MPHILEFTFHNVSINSPTLATTENYLAHLHSTMFLLIQRENAIKSAEELYLHSTMFLLIRRRLCERNGFL